MIYPYLFLQEAGLENYAAAFDLAVHLFRVLCQADASDLCSSLDNHWRTFHLKVLDYCNCVSVKEFRSVAVSCYISSFCCVLYWIEFVCTVWAYIDWTVKLGVLAAALRAFRYISHFYKFKICVKDSKIYFYLCISRPARQTYFLESVFFLDGELRQLIMVGMTSAHFGMYYVYQTYTAKVWVVTSTIGQSKAYRWINRLALSLFIFIPSSSLDGGFYTMVTIIIFCATLAMDIAC